MPFSAPMNMLLLAVLLFAQSTVATCALTPAEWTRIKDAFAQRNYYQAFVDNGDCDGSNSDSLLVKYSSCTKTLQQIVADENLEGGTSCVDALNEVLFDGEEQSSGDVLAIANDICTDAQLRHTVTDDQAVRGYFCYPLNVVGCPEGVNILQFVTFGDCMISPTANKSKEFVDNYFATGQDVQCLRNLGICPIFDEWFTCPISVNNTLSYLSTDGTYTCDNVFPFQTDRCISTFASQVELQCPRLTIIEIYFYPIVISCTVGPVFLILLYFVYRRVYGSEHISDDDVIKQAIVVDMNSDGNQSNNASFYGSPHPEMHHILKKSKYNGVKFDESTGTWGVEGMQRMYPTEKEAAQQAYLRMSEAQYGSSMPKTGPLFNAGQVAAATPATSPPPGMEPQAPPESEAEKLDRRKRQLVAFYTFWDADKPDIEAHVENLFERHAFTYILRAVRAKYGVAPPGWEDESDV